MPALKYLHLDFSSVHHYYPEDTSALDQERIKMKTLLRGLQVPSLQKLSTQEQLYDTLEPRPQSFRLHHQRLSSVSKLHLFQCRYASTNLLRDMVLPIKCLKSFVVDHHWSHDHGGIKTVLQIHRSLASIRP